MSLRLEVHPTATWGAAVGGRLAQRLSQQPGTRLCLPTGDTPTDVYAALASIGRLDTTAVFLLDEFVLPVGHPARCDEMLKRSLLDLVSHPPASVERFHVSAASLLDECARYEALVDDGGLDLTLLGLGANGHLGLNEPGATAHSRTRVVDLHAATIRHAAAYGNGTAPERGVTLGLSSILASREIWLLVTGDHKAEILHRSVAGPVGPAVPASYLQNHPNVIVMADEPAATRLAER